jgi:long-chain acyl-CoA synthetase
MREYWQQPDATSVALAGGWLHTGDVARISADGFLELVDRKKEMINTSGYKVYPREVEDVLYQHPAVAEALVIGIADDARGEIVKAFITLKSGAAADTQSIIDHCRTLLAPYKIPRAVEYRTSLPKSAVGKPLRRVLVEEERARHGSWSWPRRGPRIAELADDRPSHPTAAAASMDVARMRANGSDDSTPDAMPRETRPRGRSAD